MNAEKKPPYYKNLLKVSRNAVKTCRFTWPSG